MRHTFAIQLIRPKNANYTSTSQTKTLRIRVNMDDLKYKTSANVHYQTTRSTLPYTTPKACCSTRGTAQTSWEP